MGCMRDELETNMNPKMIRPIVQAMVASYPELNPKKLDIKFISLFRDEKTWDVHYEMKNSASDLEHNAIMQEFDAMYDREQGIIYGE